MLKSCPDKFIEHAVDFVEAELNGGKISIDVGIAKLAETECDAAIVGVAEQERLSGEVKALDEALRGEISRLMKAGTFTGEWKQFHSISSLGLVKPARIVLAGLGKEKELSTERLRIAIATAARSARAHFAKTIATDLHTRLAERTETASAVVEGALLGLYRFDRFKSPDKEKEKKIVRLILVESDKARLEAARKGCERGIILAESTNYARELVNAPSAAMYPAKLAEEADRLARRLGLKITVLDEKKLAAHGMNGILAVGGGSEKGPRFVVLEYNAGAKEKVAIVGKGITFDSGGLDIKPREHMSDMKTDKAGAATVLGAMSAAARLKLPVGIIGAFAACENMPSGSSYRPGDIVTAYNKKTMEIIDTDAEGRVVLADAVSYVEKNYRPAAIIDIATLTGACFVALGSAAAGLMGSDRRLLDKIKDASEKSAEKVWELPMWDEYKELIKSDVADFRNLGKGKPGEAGAITGAAFVGAFVESTPWAHLDIAGVANVSDSEGYNPAGATGWGVRLLIQLLSEWKKR